MERDPAVGRTTRERAGVCRSPASQRGTSAHLAHPGAVSPAVSRWPVPSPMSCTHGAKLVTAAWDRPAAWRPPGGGASGPASRAPAPRRRASRAAWAPRAGGPPRLPARQPRDSLPDQLELPLKLAFAAPERLDRRARLAGGSLAAAGSTATAGADVHQVPAAHVETSGVDGVRDAVSAPLRRDEARVPQHREMLRHRRGRDPQLFGDLYVVNQLGHFRAPEQETLPGTPQA